MASSADYVPFVLLLRQLQLTSGNLRAGIAKELGISMAELNALSHAADLEGLTPKKLSELMDLTTGSMTPMKTIGTLCVAFCRGARVKLVSAIRMSGAIATSSAA